MNKPRVVGMLVNHQEIDHLLTTISDIIRNHAYRYANAHYPVGHEKRDSYFDEDGLLRGYDVDTNKALLRDSLDHYVQFYHNASGINLNFVSYLEENFPMVSDSIANDQQTLSLLTSMFINACGILGSVLCPVLDDITGHGQVIGKIESYATSFENTFYLLHGEGPDSEETYDPKEDDLSDVDCTQTEAELNAIKERNSVPSTDQAELRTQDGLVTELGMPSSLNYGELIYAPDPTPPQQNSSVNLIWNPDT